MILIVASKDAVSAGVSRSDYALEGFGKKD
jgi:hypothetical protein